MTKSEKLEWPTEGELVKAKKKLKPRGQARWGVRPSLDSAVRVLLTLLLTLEKKVSVTIAESTGRSLKRKWKTVKWTWDPLHTHQTAQRQWTTLLIFQRTTKQDFNQQSHAGQHDSWSSNLRALVEFTGTNTFLLWGDWGLVSTVSQYGVFPSDPFLHLSLWWSLQRRQCVVHTLT